MEYFETHGLFYPEIKAVVGGYVFSRAVEIEVYSDQDSYFDWTKIRFTSDFQPEISIDRKEEGRILLGYSGVLSQVFEGYVTKSYNKGGYIDEINLKDKLLLLEETYITNTFLHTTPQEIISYCLSQAGVSVYKLTGKGFPAKKVVPIYRKNVVAVIKEIHFLWGIGERFFFSDGVFYWGEQPTQEKIYTFEYAKNIISLERPLRTWELVTVSMPFIKHSHKVNIIHPKVTGQFEVKKVTFATRETGFIRTTVYF